MPARRVSDHDLVDRLGALFRRRGFEGATLSDIATATGLQRSSLYHRFPGGKQQMAAEVTHAVVERVAAALTPLAGTGPVEHRVESAGRNLHAVYDGGTASCLLETLSIGDPGAATTAELRLAIERWIDAFAGVARESGADDAIARERAQDAIAAIEGSLVVARLTGDRGPFERALARLSDVLLGRRP